jgi:hypothetical protein
MRQTFAKKINPPTTMIARLSRPRNGRHPKRSSTLARWAS